MIQARHVPSEQWFDYGTNIGFIEAAKKHASVIRLINGCVEVRDFEDASIPVGNFKLVRKITYEVLNPRQDSE